MPIINQHHVPALTKSVRLSDYLVGIFTELPTRKGVKKAIRRGEVLVNRQAVGTGHWVQTGQVIQLLESTQPLPKIFELLLTIVYEDEYLAVINKPAGLVVSGNQFRTVQNALLFNLIPSLLPDALRLPRPVHRLDAATSGLLLIAKTAGALNNLSKQFAQQTIEKRYRAIVAGQTPITETINIPIDNQTATTALWRLRRVPSLKNEWITLVDLLPQTGRTHQLRVHCARSGFPIMGDQLYGEKGKILWKKGLFLAAVELQFMHPDHGGRIVVTTPMPNKFELLLAREERRFFTKRNAGN